MKIPEETLQQITDATDIVDVIGQHVTLKRYGRVYKGLCPFHNEKTPSFNVDPDKKFFYCFGCQKGGSAFKFLMEMEGLSFRDAAENLAQKAGIVLELEKGSQEVDDKWKALRDLYTRVNGSFQYLLIINLCALF